MTTIYLFFVGRRYYLNSGTIMSWVYEVGFYARADWGMVERALAGGRQINIRPASQEELEWADKKLEAIRNEAGV